MLGELRHERDRIDQAIQALEGLGAPRKKAAVKGRRHMSADARARISKAMKMRWAQRKKSS
jgi:hypothetical protein